MRNPTLRAVDRSHGICPECGTAFRVTPAREVRVVNALSVVAIVLSTFAIATLLWLAVAWMFVGVFFSGTGGSAD